MMRRIKFNVENEEGRKNLVYQIFMDDLPYEKTNGMDCMFNSVFEIPSNELTKWNDYTLID